jgi:hypothetical protein
MAHIAGLMGDRSLALADLSLAIDRHESELQGFDHDRAYKAFANDPDFRRIVEKLKNP